MTPENFCYWLQGIFEIQMAGLDLNTKKVPHLSEAQMDMVYKHLQYVFTPKISPVDPFSTHAQATYPGLVDPTKGPTSFIC